MRRLAALLVALACTAPAAAQERANEPSDAQRCLRHVDGPEAQPVYPGRAYNDNRGARVQVEMRFTAPDRAPEARVLLHEGEPEFLEAVEVHLRGLRVPCLPAGASPAVLQREYEFAADRRRVHWSEARDMGTAGREHLWACLKHAGGQPSPEYPQSALRRNVQGRVLAQMEFHDPQQPPRVKVHTRPDAEPLGHAVSQWAEGYRLPCLSGEPMRSVFTFVFRVEGNDRFGFRNALTLPQFLGSVRGIRQQALEFNTSTMGCPFEVQLQYRQPNLPNLVGEPGEPVPARRPLLQWLAASELELRPQQINAIYGDWFKLAVPCINIDLKPKEN